MFSFYATCEEEMQSVIKEVGGLIYILRETIRSVPPLIRVELIRRGHWSEATTGQGAPWTGHCSYTGMTHRHTTIHTHTCGELTQAH